jgi:tripartite-type tricarboxylate transporter receptor subunit TctC
MIATAVLAGTAGAKAEDAYPNRVIHLIVPYPPGGGADTVARVVAQKLGENIHDTIIIENRAGAATNIGMEATVRATPDGYTLGLATSNLAINPPLYPNMKFHAKQDLAPVGLLTKGLYVLVVNKSVPANSVKELIALAKAKPGTLNAAIAGFGTPGHLALAQFNMLTGANLTPIPYQGAAPALNSVLSDTSQVLFISMASARPFVKAGSMRMLAITSSEHSAEMPSVPNAKEAGLPGDEIFEWYGIVAPKGVDPKHIAFLSTELRKVLTDADIQKKLSNLGAEASPDTHQQFGAFIDEQSKKLGEIVRRSGLKAQ